MRISYALLLAFLVTAKPIRFRWLGPCLARGITVAKANNLMCER